MKKAISKGLCETCIRKEECTYIRMNSEPVHFCEEFTSGCKGNDGFEFRTESENVCEEGYAGLCKNCENRKCCSICQKGMPVWQCEEYI